MVYPGAPFIKPGEADRILTRDVFFYFLDLEVKRSRRYQNFFCILIAELAELPHPGNGAGFQACFRRLTELLIQEMRDSDILGALGENRLGVILPYADLLAGGHTRSRFQNSLQYCDFGPEGYQGVTELICFPRDGTDTSDLIRKMAGGLFLNS